MIEFFLWSVFQAFCVYLSHLNKLAILTVPVCSFFFMFGYRFCDCAFSFCSYWDMAYDSDVMDNRVGLNLLYAQVRGFIT